MGCTDSKSVQVVDNMPIVNPNAFRHNLSIVKEEDTVTNENEYSNQPQTISCEAADLPISRSPSQANNSRPASRKESETISNRVEVNDLQTNLINNYNKQDQSRATSAKSNKISRPTSSRSNQFEPNTDNTISNEDDQRASQVSVKQNDQEIVNT